MWLCAVSKFGNCTCNCVTHFGSGNTNTVAKPRNAWSTWEWLLTIPPICLTLQPSTHTSPFATCTDLILSPLQEHLCYMSLSNLPTSIPNPSTLISWVFATKLKHISWCLQEHACLPCTAGSQAVSWHSYPLQTPQGSTQVYHGFGVFLNRSFYSPLFCNQNKPLVMPNGQVLTKLWSKKSGTNFC